MDEEKEITKAKCEFCGEKVTPCIDFSESWTRHNNSPSKNMLNNRINTNWSCRNHGGVWAKIGKKLYKKPEELFKSVFFRGYEIKVIKCK